jgi:hypothetical protein
MAQAEAKNSLVKGFCDWSRSKTDPFCHGISASLSIAVAARTTQSATAYTTRGSTTGRDQEDLLAAILILSREFARGSNRSATLTNGAGSLNSSTQELAFPMRAQDRTKLLPDSAVNRSSRKPRDDNPAL